MQPWAELQSAFAAAVMDPAKPVPDGMTGLNGKHAGGRFAVYRNNVMTSLVEALQDRFPTTTRLVGEEFFRAMARVYVAGSLPRSPLLLEYGATFPDFIADFDPAGSVPYLADVARLEAAWSEAYHAADAVSLDAAALHAANPEELGSASIELHPSLRLVRSSYPVAALWQAHQRESVEPILEWQAEDVLILRPDASVSLQTLSGGVYEFIAAVLEQQSILEAGEAALAVAPQFKLGHCLVELFATGAIVALKPASSDTV